METVDINSLNPNPKNPRQISTDDYQNLKRSIIKFGDLSGIIYNETTEQLVGGHQRLQAFKELGGQPVITHRLEQPNSVGTVARGHVLLGDEEYSYRVVHWPLEQKIDKFSGQPAVDADGKPVMICPWEMAANVAANRIEGEFDLDLLKELNFELSQLENASELLALTGQREDEILSLLHSAGLEEPTEKVDREENTMTFHMTQEQSEIVNNALLLILSKNNFDLEANPDKYGNALYALSRFYLERSDAAE